MIGIDHTYRRLWQGLLKYRRTLFLGSLLKSAAVSVVLTFLFAELNSVDS